MVSRVRFSSSEIDRHLHRQADSDLSVGEYCREHGLKVQNFRNWQSVRRRSRQSTPGHWVELTQAVSPEPVQTPDCSGTQAGVLVELQLPGGIVLRIKPAAGVAG